MQKILLKHTKIKTLLILLLCACLIMQGQYITYAEEDDNTESSSLDSMVDDELVLWNGDDSYEAYLENYRSMPKASDEVVIYAVDYIDTDQEVEFFDKYQGSSMASLLTKDSGYVEWEFEVHETGMYQMNIDYLGYGGNGSAIERELLIDGKVPYTEARYLVLPRIWCDDWTEDLKDKNGNDIKPSQSEVVKWQNQFIKNTSGYYAEPLMFYLEKGKHTLRLNSLREPVMIEKITFCNKANVKTYDEVKSAYTANNYKEASGKITYIEAERMYEKSEKSNYPQNDRSSVYTQPQEIYKIVFNSMGGSKWQNAGSSVTWELTVPETGLYKIAFRYRQNINSGIFSSRKLTIDGEVPFKEAENIKFYYDTDWQCMLMQSMAMGNGDEDYLFYFEAGKTYQLGMEVVLGDTADIIREVEEVVVDLNTIYRRILMITGANPDKKRDYQFEKIIPDTLSEMVVQADKLINIIDNLAEISGGKGEKTAQLAKLENQVRRMAKDPEEIASRFNSFKDNIAALGTWILETAKQPLELDYIALIPDENELPKAEGGFFKKLFYSIQIFIASFIIDYSEIGILEGNENYRGTITVWIATGRDQQNTLRGLINSDFTKDTGIGVNLQLVNPGTLLPSILAGNGPDVALSNAMGDPINFALRNAVKDISGFDGFDEVSKRFYESAMVPYQYYGATYALPETQSFNMLFYRTDIFESLSLTPPQTWSDWDNIIGELRKKNMTIGIGKDLNTMLTFMYQMDAPLYMNNGEYTNLDSREAMLSFNKMVEYFTLYDFPREYDFVNRFRSGEMPMAIADYTVYNQLSLFAPEIKGNWAMTLVPGTMREDGTINRYIPSSGTAVMMMEDTKNPELAWEFMKWWTSAEIQAAFGIEMESVINASAKQPTANVEALKMLPWATKDLESILKQWEYVKGVPEVPGGYYTGRIITFAFNKAFDKKYKESPIDILQSYIENVNSELVRKRQEFGIIE